MKFFVRNIMLAICLIYLGFDARSQWQNAHWRFGYSGSLDFTPTSATIGSPTQTLTPEGAAAVSNRNTGALLFYTDGVTVWNSNNVPMPNGTGLFGGTPDLLSSTTAASIVREPGSENRFWIFTIDEQSSSNGLRYSIVDMTLAGGLGDVLPDAKNVPVYATTSEKLLIVPNSTNTGYWIVTHDNQNSFYCFALTSAGLNTNPVICNVSAPQFNGAGHFKMNRTFDRLAMGSLFDGNIGLYPFNNSTGAFSAPVEWSFSFGITLQYGIEFSPNGRLLYVSNLENLVQYDLSSGDAATIQASAYTVFQGNAFNGSPATLQLAFDRKIYCNLGGSIATIECPNLQGVACGFVQDAFPGNAGGGYGLNPWVYDIEDIEIPVQPSLVFGSNNCADEPVSFQFNFPLPYDVINVNWGDGNTSSFNNIGDTISWQYSQAGNYNISLQIGVACEVWTIDTTINIVSCTPLIPEVPQLMISGDTCTIGSALSAQVAINGNYDQVRIDFGEPSGAGNTAVFNNVSADFSVQHVYGAPGIYSICMRVVEDTLLDTTVCVDVTVGLCCRFQLDIAGLCTELPSTATITGTNTADTYLWTITSPTGEVFTAENATPELPLNEAGLYTWQVTLNGECGERQLEENLVKSPCTAESCAPFIPNSFTPDNDGVNDVFAPVFGCDTPYRFRIFDRWGQTIFDSDAEGKVWTGGVKEYYAMDGIYAYMVEYTNGNQTTETVKGHVLLIR